MRRLSTLIRESAKRSGPFNLQAIGKDLLHGTSVGQDILFRLSRGASEQTREYTVQLPAGYPATAIRIRLTTPRLPPRPLLGFSDHVLDECGRPTDTVLAVTTGGFAVSHDLGHTWKIVRLRDRQLQQHQILHVKAIGNGELLAQAAAERWRPGLPHEIENLVLDLQGHVLATTRVTGSHWHGCRSVDRSGRTLMYAEYPFEDPAGTHADRAPSRAMRSRDRGRTWETVFLQQGTEIRHFHFLQARPGIPGEWWLTSGDSPMESRIWVSKDDGDHWEDLTSRFGDPVMIDGLNYPRTLFRLTDLVWEGDQVMWGTDDYLARNNFPFPGARIFRSPSGHLSPKVAGKAKWQVRNIVDVEPFYIILTQGGLLTDVTPEERRPGVYLIPKTPIPGTPDMVHLFDVDGYSQTRTGFTYSRASRAAKDGIFFTYRAGTDVFPFGHKCLRWEVTFS
ncbi:MAG: hypothetical protein JO056_04555 [Alphaproteobacteria bacterium]|nr:hypothetical protein [Alphaproteobacteria bacterium]